MKFTIVTETYLPFRVGVSSSTDSIARFMVKKGHEVTVISPKPVLPVEEVEKELKLIYTPSLKDLFFAGKPMSPWPMPLPTMFREIKKEKVDLVHIQEPGALGTAALIFAKLRRVLVVGALHFTPEQSLKFVRINPLNLTVIFFNNYIKFVYNFYDAIMVPTQTFAQMLKKVGVKKEIVVVSNGVDTKRFVPGKKDPKIFRKYDLPRDKVLFFFLSRLDKDKNITTIIKGLLKTSEKVHLIIGGKGIEEENLKAFAKELKVDKKISWLGHLPEEDLVKVYQAMDCFVLMSPYEVQSIVTLQAIACGLPVIASNEGALPELIHEGENGFLVDTYDFDTLAQKMEIVASEENLRKKFGLASRQIALPHEREINLEKLNNLYLSLQC